MFYFSTNLVLRPIFASMAAVALVLHLVGGSRRLRGCFQIKLASRRLCPSLVQCELRLLTFVRYLLVAVDEPDVVERHDVRGESPVHAEDLLVDEGGHGQEVEHAAAVPPRVSVAVLCLALV